MKKEYNFSKGKRGAVVPVVKGKTRITIRIDDDILNWFRDQVDAAGGGNYQKEICTPYYESDRTYFPSISKSFSRRESKDPPRRNPEAHHRALSGGRFL